MLVNDRKHYIFGAGKNVDTVIDQLEDIFYIDAIIDNDQKKTGAKVRGREILFAGEILDDRTLNDHRIIVSVTERKAKSEILSLLNRKGFKKGIDYVEAEDLCTFRYERIPGEIIRRKDPVFGTAYLSFDPASYLIETDDRRILRVINRKETEKTKRVFEKCKQSDLFDTMIINSWITEPLNGKERELVIEHEYIEHITFCHEWPDNMIKDFVIWNINLLELLDQSGLRLSDIHAHNATFYKGRFIHFDFGSIDMGRTGTKELYDFMGYLILPFLLMCKGQRKTAFFYLEDMDKRMDLRDVKGYLSKNEYEELCKLYRDIAFKKDGDFVDVLLSLKAFVEKIINVENKLISGWSYYQDDEWEWNNKDQRWSEKMRNAVEMVESVRVKNIIDIAGNQGWYSCYHRNNVKNVIVVDMDVQALNKLYKRILEQGLINVYPVYMSICAPSLGRHIDGFVDGKAIRPIRESGVNRLKADLVIALAIVHHLAFRECLLFEEIIALLSEYTMKYMLVEFVEKEDAYLTEFQTEGFDWYTKKEFERILSNNFKILDKKASSPKETRTLYLCEKKSGSNAMF